MNWFKKNKNKLILGAAIAALLVFAFWYGGDAPGLKGWSVNNKQSQQIDVEKEDKNRTASETETKTDEQDKSDESETKSTGKITEDSEKKESEKSAEKADTEKKTEKTDAEAEKKTEQHKQVIDPKTGKDKYQTDPVPEGKPIPVEPEDQEKSEQVFYCTFSISCENILNNMEYLHPEKKQCVPDDGWILLPQSVSFTEGENVYEVLSRVCRDNGIHMEASFTPMYNSAYIEGINNLYEFDCGQLSGWMYKVNEWFPNYGASRYVLKNGDVCCWVYTCDLGYDVGGGYAMGE